MSIPAITPSAYTNLKAIRILPKSKENVNRQYLYNEVLDITRKMKVPASFHTNKIELPTPTISVVAKLKELGISFIKIAQ